MALRNTAEGSVSGADLSQRLGITRAAIWARIEALRALGFDIEASPHKGYRLASSPNRLYADDLAARIGKTRVVGRIIRVFEETNSTNDLVDRLARDEAKEGLVIFAETQTKGRGRMGRTWLSPRCKGLWFSVLLRPQLPPRAATQITIAAVTALARAIQKQAHLTPEIKWPNDILLRGRKAAGILTEMTAELDKIKHVIIGIGLNVNLGASDFPPEMRHLATSLRLETGQEISRPELAANILRELDHDYGRVSEGKFTEIADEWGRQCATIGQHVTIVVGDRKVSGRAESLDGDGALLLRAQHGHLERIIGGDVLLEK
jgi:BirA family biotin operon repressor/biotin-[acetyl-CoA-carboxylase] ligase